MNSTTSMQVAPPGDLKVSQPGQTMKRIPTLDGWRGIAIALVLFDHIWTAILYPHKLGLLQTGQHGVTIFFVLSGFLITTNLISGPIELKKFYIRRFFRLMPVAWTFLAALILLDYIGGVHLTSWAAVRSCLLFYRNYFGPTHGGSMAGQFWSLSIEEQFYLVWPSLLLLLGVRRCRWVAGLGAISIAIYRWRMWQYYEIGVRGYQTEVRADALLVGCLLALLLADQAIYQRAVHISKWLAIPATAGLFLGMTEYHLMIPLWESVSIAILLAATMLHPHSIPSRILSCKPLVWLGLVSYSIYIWQEPFMWFVKNPFILALSLCVYMPLFALGSYYLIERPFTRFGRRITSRNNISAMASEQLQSAIPN